MARATAPKPRARRSVPSASAPVAQRPRSLRWSTPPPDPARSPYQPPARRRSTIPWTSMPPCLQPCLPPCLPPVPPRAAPAARDDGAPGATGPICSRSKRARPAPPSRLDGRHRARARRLPPAARAARRRRARTRRPASAAPAPRARPGRRPAAAPTSSCRRASAASVARSGPACSASRDCAPLRRAGVVRVHALEDVRRRRVAPRVDRVEPGLVSIRAPRSARGSRPPGSVLLAAS